jgi:hypothetical protein
MKTILVRAATAGLLLLGCSSGDGKKNPPAAGGSGGAGAGGAGEGGSGGGSGGSPATGGAGGSSSPIVDAAADSSATPGADGAGDVVETPPGMALETVQVPGSGDAVSTKTSLEMGQLYLLKAAGSVDLGGQKVDAEYVFGAGMPADEMGAVDPGVDIGLLQIHPKVHTTATPPGPGRMKWSPTRPYREDHVYYVTVTGAAKPLSLKLTKPSGAGSGTIAVSLFALSPPRGIGAEVDTVNVPFQKVMVMSKPTELGKQYLLQASGQGKVSTNGVGDAEYMDYDPAGTRFNEGESGADFGVGVDESDLLGQKPPPAGYKARTRWWGTWRVDHTYYMLFTGTGKEIPLLYFDSGYGDNTGVGDHITVKIFAAP